MQLTALQELNACSCLGDEKAILLTCSVSREDGTSPWWWTVPQNLHIHCRAVVHASVLMTSEDCWPPDGKVEEATGLVGSSSKEENVGAEDWVTKSALPSLLDRIMHLTLAVWAQPHCRGRFLSFMEFRSKVCWTFILSASLHSEKCVASPNICWPVCFH